MSIRPRRLALPLAVALLSAACGDDKNPTSTARFPSVAGTYSVSGTFDAVPGAAFSGPLVVQQASRANAALTGSLTLTLTGLPGGSISGTEPLHQATVTQQGDIDFQFGPPQSGAMWRFSGRVTGNSISGRHTLSDGSQSFGGPWGATKQ